MLFRSDFKWKTSTPLATGVRNAIGWYKTHPITETFTHLKQEKK